MVVIEIRDLVNAKKWFSKYILEQEYLPFTKTWCVVVSDSEVAKKINELF